MKRRSTLVGTLLLVLVIAAAGSLPAFAQGSAPEAATTKSLSTNYTVMNLSATTATVHVDYMKAFDGITPGGTWTASAGNTDFSLNAGTSKVIAQYLDPVMTAGAGSATISSDQPTAAIVNQLARGQVPTSGSYTAFQEGAASFYMPFAFKKLNSSVGQINSTIVVMNVGSAATNVEIDLVNADGTPRYTKVINALPAGESFTYDQNTEADANLPAGWYGSAKVRATTAGGLVAAVGNQFTGVNGLLTYQGFAAGYRTWVVPLYMVRLANGWNSNIAIQNVGANPIPALGATITFTPDPAVGGGAFTVQNQAAIAPGATWAVNPHSDLISFPAGRTGSYGAATIDAGANNTVVAIVNQLKNEPPNVGDNALSYNAIPTNLTGTKVVAPIVMSRLTNLYSTALTIANLTGTAGTCNFVYTPDPAVGGSAITVNNVTLPAGGSIIHNHRLASSPIPPLWYGAAAVTCTQPVGGVVNQLWNAVGGDPDLSYNAFTVAP